MLRQYEAEDLAPLAEQLRQENRRALWIALGVFIGAQVILITLGMINGPPNPFTFIHFGAVAIPIANASRGYKQRRQAFTNAQNALSQRMDRRSLGSLLQIRAACQNDLFPEATKLTGTCDTMLRRHLPRATEDELQRLSLEARRYLASLLRPSLGSIWTRPAFEPNQEPNILQAELATAILLTLTSLKQPGGEKSARRILKHFKNETLREAAQDYMNSLSA